MNEEIQRYSSTLRTLLHSQRYKVKKILEHRCIRYMSLDQSYICDPIQGYNTSIYKMKRNSYGEWEYTCQYYVRNLEPCSHIGALMTYFLYHQNYNEVERAISRGELEDDKE